MADLSSRLSWPTAQLRGTAVPAVMLFAACVLTALAARHISRAHGGVLLLHLVAGGLGLLLPLAAVAWVLRPSHAVERRARVGAVCALTASGIAAVWLCLLGWLALAAGLAAQG